MDPVLYVIPVTAALVALRVYLAFGRPRSRWFLHRFPGRRAEEIAGLWGVGLAAAVLVVQLAASGTTDFPLFIIPMMLGSAVSVLLGWRAGRAGEPAWRVWKSSLPARPDR